MYEFTTDREMDFTTAVSLTGVSVCVGRADVTAGDPAVGIGGLAVSVADAVDGGHLQDGGQASSFGHVSPAADPQRTIDERIVNTDRKTNESDRARWRN